MMLTVSGAKPREMKNGAFGTRVRCIYFIIEAD